MILRNSNLLGVSLPDQSSSEPGSSRSSIVSFFFIFLSGVLCLTGVLSSFCCFGGVPDFLFLRSLSASTMAAAVSAAFSFDMDLCSFLATCR